VFIGFNSLPLVGCVGAMGGFVSMDVVITMPVAA
jgi:hypothetical protein